MWPLSFSCLFCTVRMIKHSFNLHLPPSLAPSSLMMFSFLWHARTTCVRILKPFVGARDSLFFFSPTVVNAPQIPVGVRGVNTASLSGLLEKTLLLFIMNYKTCGLFLYSERERERGGGVWGQRKMRSCFCYYHHVLAGKIWIRRMVTSLFLFNFSWRECAHPFFCFS